MLQDSSIPWIFLLLLLIFRLVYVEAGGGGLLVPQARSSVWREDVEVYPESEDDINCGGVVRQWGSWQGRCGVCGDEWGIPAPRPHELGGKWGSGVIAGKYLVGQTVDVEIEVTPSLGGSFQLHLCPDPSDSSDQCFSQYPLYLATTNTTTYHPQPGDKLVRLQYQLPHNMTCTHCVLQWRYITNHKVTLEDQDNFYLEEFRACADIAIQAVQTVQNDQDVTTMQSIGSEVAVLEVKETVTEETAVTIVDVLDEIKSNTESEMTDISTTLFSVADVTTIAPSVLIEYRTEAIKPPVTTSLSVEIVEDTVVLNEFEETIEKSVRNIEQVDEKISQVTEVSEELTVKPGVVEITIFGGSSSKEESPVYTIAPEQMPLEYSLIRISETPLNNETNQEDTKADYEITRTKPTTNSVSLILSPPASVTSVIPLSSSITSLQTTDRISDQTTVTPVNVLVTSISTIKTSTTTKSTTPTNMLSSVGNIHIFLSTESDPKSTTLQHLVTQSSMVKSTTTTTPSTTTTTTKSTTLTTKAYTNTIVTITTSSTQTLSTVTPKISIITTATIKSTTLATSTTQLPTTEIKLTTPSLLFQKVFPKHSSDNKFVSNTINSISVETLEKVLKVPNPKPKTGSTTNHTVIYQVFSRGPALGYGLFLSVPAAIIFFVGVFLVYLKKKSEIPKPQKPQIGSTMYHSVPKDDTEVGEDEITQLTNMTSSTTLITSEYIPTRTTMCPEYASIPDVVPSSGRNSQRHRLDVSVDESCYPGNSMPNLNKVINIPIEETYAETSLVQYSSLNELNSTENSPKSSGGENHGKRWQSDDLDGEKKAQDTPVDGWTPHQRWKSEDWEKDQSFIALLARRLEHVDSRAEVTEL